MADNLKNIIDLVKEDLPFTSSADDSKILSKKIQSMYKLQRYLFKTDAEVELEESYKPLERILIAKVTSYDLLQTKSIEVGGGNSGLGTEAGNSFLKKAKADVVEAEFEQMDVKKTASLGKTAESIMSDLMKEICSIAMTLDVVLPYCDGREFDAFQPFVFVFDC